MLYRPTVVLLAGFKYFCPGETVKDFYRRAFGGKTSLLSLVIAAVITLSATLITVLALSLIRGKEFGSYWSLGVYPFWAFWHTVLWFVDSDYMGIRMIPYIISNLVVMTGLCFIMNFFMEKHDNLIYGIVIHFCFNFLYCFLQVDIWFYVVLSVVYLMIIAVIYSLKKHKG